MIMVVSVIFDFFVIMIIYYFFYLVCDFLCLYFSVGEVIKLIELFFKKVILNVIELQVYDGWVFVVVVDVEEKIFYFSDQVSRIIR